MPIYHENNLSNFVQDDKVPVLDSKVSGEQGRIGLEGSGNCILNGHRYSFGARRSSQNLKALRSPGNRKFGKSGVETKRSPGSGLSGTYTGGKGVVSGSSLGLAMLDYSKWANPAMGCLGTHELECSPSVGSRLTEYLNIRDSDNDAVANLLYNQADDMYTTICNQLSCGGGLNLMLAGTFLCISVCRQIRLSNGAVPDVRMEEIDAKIKTIVKPKVEPQFEQGWFSTAHEHLLVWERLLLRRPNKFKQGRALNILVYYAGCYFGCMDELPPVSELILSMTPALDYGVWYDGLLRTENQEYSGEIVEDLMLAVHDSLDDDEAAARLTKWCGVACFQDCMVQTRTTCGPISESGGFVLQHSVSPLDVMIMRSLDAMGWPYGSKNGRLWLDPEELEYQVLNYLPHDIMDMWKDYVGGEPNNGMRLHDLSSIGDVWQSSMILGWTGLRSIWLSHVACRNGDPRGGVGIATGLFTVVSSRQRRLFGSMLQVLSLFSIESRRQWFADFEGNCPRDMYSCYSELLCGTEFKWDAAIPNHWPSGLLKVIREVLKCDGYQPNTPLSQWLLQPVQCEASSEMHKLLVSDLCHLIVCGSAQDLLTASKDYDERVDVAFGRLGEFAEDAGSDVSIVKKILLNVGAWSLGIPVLANLCGYALLDKYKPALLASREEFMKFIK
ncbi:hypothetical protein K7432_009351 [Basidiobolus ranarum]|uniref:Uncharacterized protein n=1 Tax=Basidiobolus ranarum TaxID=34480 RepID=A0ABR2WQJ4_9FUNG